jgi:hypothetical protein
VTEPGDQPIYDIGLPPGTEAVLGVFVNGVPRHEGDDYQVLSDRIRLREPIASRGTVSGVGKLLISIGIGVYPKGDVVDLQLRRGGREDVVRGRPLSELA